MKQVLAAVLGTGLVAGACAALGLILMERLRLDVMLRRAERLPLSFALGASLLHLLVFILLALQIAYWPLLVLVVLIPLAEATRRRLWRPRGLELAPVPRSLLWAGGLAGGAFLVVYFVYALAPEHSPDGSMYHMGLVARELRTHGFEKITTTFYAMLGQGIELVYLPAFAIGRHSAAALTHLAFAVSLVWSMFTFGRQMGKPWVGAAAALFTFLSPVFGISASVAYVDAATAAVVFAAFYWLEVWDRERSFDQNAWRLLIPVGLLAGYAFAAKFTAFTIGLYALGFVAWRARRLKPALLVTACALLTAGPWVARNWALYDNPTAPLGNWLFRNPYVHIAFERDYSQFLQTYGVEDKAELPLEVTLRGEKTQGVTGPLFLLLPFGLLALRRRTGRRIWLAAALLTSTYLANVGTRFLIPSLPFFSFSIALAVGETPLLLGTLLMLHALLSWPPNVPIYAAKYAWRMDTLPWRAALRLRDPDQYLRQLIPGYPAARLINEKVPKGEVVFTQSGVPDAYCDRELLVNFQSASNEVASDIFHMGWMVGSQPIRADLIRFSPIRAQRLRVTQTAQVQGPEQWNVHELRFFSKGQEVARSSEWRLRAWPMPADAGMAFDNTGATRWRSWEPAAPGMYLDVDFGREETVDEIRVERSPDSTQVRMQPEVLKPGGAWEPLQFRLESTDVQPNPNSRRMATYELNARGIRYVLLFDTDFGAQDVRDDPEAWALELVGSVDRARLYRSTWP